MNTFLSSSQEALKEQYRTFARNELAPHAKDLESGHLSLRDFLQKLGRAGYLGITVPVEYGGQGGSLLNFILLVEALCEFEPGLGLTLSTHQVVIELLQKYGSSSQKSRHLPSLASGDIIAGFAQSEENAGTDFQAVQTLLEHVDDQYLLTGKKTWVVNGELANLLVVLAKLKDDAASADSLGFVLANSGPKMKVSANRSKLGLQSALTNDIEFNRLPVSPDDLLAYSEHATQQVLFAMDIAGLVMAAAAIGLVEGALRESADHARSRQQFGKNIGQNQAVQWKLADMAVDLAGARLQVYRAAWAKEESSSEFRKYAAMCKWFAARAARLHSGEAVQIMGSLGIVAESPVERFYRDAKVMEVAQGTSEFQKMLLVKELEI